MSATSTRDTAQSVPGLVNKLCNHLAKHNSAIAARLYKLSISYLLSNQCEYEVVDKEVVAQLRQHIKTTQSNDAAKQFDSIYTRIHTSNVLTEKGNLIAFFCLLSNLVSTNAKKMDPKKWLPTSDTFVPLKKNVKNQYTFLPDDPTAGVKKIYQSSFSRKSSTSTRTQGSASVNANWAAMSDGDICKDQLSSYSTSRGAVNVATDAELIQEVVYSFQGIEGKIIKKEAGGVGFTIDARASKTMTRMQKGLIIRLTSVGFLHNQLKQYCDQSDKQIGLIGQSLITVLHNELANYYHLIATLQSQSTPRSPDDESDLTLRRMVVWVADPQLNMQWLTHIAEQCADKKGGALISAVYGFLHHGAPRVQNLAENVLSAVCRPLYVMLSNWLLDGELNDPCGEFFIEARTIKDVERLWHDKYHVRKSMIPSFITVDQANKILATGKSINFLRQICKDVEELPVRDTLQKLFANNLEALFNPERSIELHTALENVYRETSARVLDLLKNKYMLLEHLHAMRRYLLLGQGDFILHLLELLAPELSQPACNLYAHALSAILDSAIRATTAQYEDEETISRLTVCMMQHSNEDVGWDVFSLMYNADGPVGTILQPSVATYKGLFGGLWKAKRMEFVLANMRRQQISSNKLLKRMKELKVVTHHIHVVSSEMIHFLHQTQYYFLFEVLECSWAEMLKQVNQAASLDDVISAHDTFLSSVQSGVLLDDNSAELRKYLGSIFNLIINLESLQKSLYTTALKEKDRLNAYDDLIDKSSFGITMEVEKEHRERVARFTQYLTVMHSQIHSVATNFRHYVIKYVSLLAHSSDMNLQLLATRLNFNDYYKIN